MEKHIRPEGWHNWNKPEAEVTPYYAEYGLKRAGANPSVRVKWIKQLSEEEVQRYTCSIFGDWKVN